jgi:hypothetical protein
LNLLTRVAQFTQTEIALLKTFLQLIFVKSRDLLTSLPIVQADKRVNPIQPCIYVKRHTHLRLFLDKEIIWLVRSYKVIHWLDYFLLPF